MQSTEPTRSRRRRFRARGPSIDVLYTEYARRHRIDPAATFTAAREVEVAAPVERVWQVLAQIDQWSSLDPTLSDIRLDGGVVEGARFTWRNGRSRLTSRLAVVDPFHELTWVGSAWGAKVVHRNVLTSMAGDRTRFRTEESMSGSLLVLFFSDVKLREALDAWLHTFKTAAESSPP